MVRDREPWGLYAWTVGFMGIDYGVFLARANLPNEAQRCPRLVLWSVGGRYPLDLLE